MDIIILVAIIIISILILPYILLNFLKLWDLIEGIIEFVLEGIVEIIDYIIFGPWLYLVEGPGHFLERLSWVIIGCILLYRIFGLL